MRTNAAKWAAFLAVGMVAAAAALVVIAEPSEGNVMSTDTLMLIKLTAAVAIAACAKVAERLYRKGYLPDEIINAVNEEDELWK